MRKVKNSIKKMMALCLAAIMTLAMATTAFAADRIKTGNLTVNVNEGNTLKGQTIKVYKLFDLSVSDTHYAYTVNADYKNAIATALGLSKEATSEQLYNKLAEYKENPSGIQKFANDFTAAALKAGTAETGTSKKLGEVTEYKFENLDYGYYLVYQTGTKEIQSSLVSVDDVDVTVNLKGQAPSIDKTANATTVEIGQVVTYTIKGTIPDTTGYDKYTYKIHDTLTEGLDFVKDAVGTAQEGTSYNVSVKIGEGQAETKAATLSGENNRIMTLDLSEWIRNNQNSKGQEFTVTYYAKVNADAVVQTNNSAHLEYGNDPDNITTTTPDVVTTPTYPVQIHKLIKDQQNSYLAGAIFRLYRSEEDANNNQNAIAVTGSNGTYTVDPEQVGDNEEFIRRHWLGGRTADCIGLIKGYAWFNCDTGQIEYRSNGVRDTGSDPMLDMATEKGTIDTMPDIPGIAVWMDGHIGIYVGGGQTIHAANTELGVIMTPLAQSGWTHWLKIPYISYDEPIEKEN